MTKIMKISQILTDQPDIEPIRDNQRNLDPRKQRPVRRPEYPGILLGAERRKERRNRPDHHRPEKRRRRIAMSGQHQSNHLPPPHPPRRKSPGKPLRPPMHLTKTSPDARDHHAE
jgi:hypothetical protein